MFMSSAHDRTVFPAGNSADFPSSANVTRGIDGGFYGTMGHIRTSHERRRFDVPEAELLRAPAELRDLVGRVVAADRVVVAGGGEVLTHREDADAAGAKIGGDLQDLLFSLAEAEHDARLRQHSFFVSPAQDVERP